MTTTRRGSATFEYGDHTVTMTRKFEAPMTLVFDAITKPEHVSVWFPADDVTLHDLTDEMATIAVEGPESASVLERLGAPAPEASPVSSWTFAASSTSLLRRQYAQQTHSLQHPLR